MYILIYLAGHKNQNSSDYYGGGGVEGWRGGEVEWRGGEVERWREMFT